MAGEKRAASSPPPEERTIKAPKLTPGEDYGPITSQSTGGIPAVFYRCESCGQEHDALDGDGDIDLCAQCRMAERQALAMMPRELIQHPQPASVPALAVMPPFAGYGLAPPQQQTTAMNPGAPDFPPPPVPPHLLLGSKAAATPPLFAPALSHSQIAMENPAAAKPPNRYNGCTSCNRGYQRNEKNTGLYCTKCCNVALRAGNDPWAMAGEPTPSHVQEQLARRVGQ